MDDARSWVDDESAFLLTDLYQLTMLQAYWREGMQADAVFSLFLRELPPERNYVVACGLDDALRYLERLHVSERALAYLSRQPQLRPDFLRWLARLRFEGDVYAVPEGTPVFPPEPLLEVVAPIPQAQLVESFLLNQVHLQSVLASKAARVVEAARGRAVVDFGMRRAHGTDAALKGARAFHVAGVDATSDVLAGEVYGIPITGTMAHSYVEAHEDERAALRAFACAYPEGAVLLVDTYDTLEGVRRVVALARELGDAFRVRGVRLDSGDLAALARGARAILDAAGLGAVQIFASGGLDERAIADLLARGAPIDGFGVGTRLAVATDAPAFDMVYKLVEYAGRARLKTSSGKATLPGRKQILRCEAGGAIRGDVLTCHGEDARTLTLRDGAERCRPLLRKVMEGGRRLPAGEATLACARRRAREERERLPPRIRAITPAAPPYPVALSEGLVRLRETTRRRLAG